MSGMTRGGGGGGDCGDGGKKQPRHMFWGGFAEFGRKRWSAQRRDILFPLKWHWTEKRFYLLHES